MDRTREIIRFDNVTKCFWTAARGEVCALRDINLVCNVGELTCILGPSGCGKTTLLRLAAGLDSPTRGGIFVHNSPVTGPPPNIGMVSQEGALLPWRRVLGNVALGLEIRGVPRTQRRDAARRVLERVHLPPEVERSFPHELSGGMRQRVALGRALCADPPVLLMDEPFSRLDEPTRNRLQEELLNLWAADHQTVLFVTHSIEEAVFLADRLVVMTFAKTVADFRMDLPRPRDRLSSQFIEMLLEVRQAFAEDPDKLPAPRT